MLTAWDIASREQKAQLKAHENNPMGLMTGSPDDFHALGFGGGYFKLMPGPEFNPWIFRGQVQFHHPCKSSLHRGAKDKLGLFIDRLRCVQFEQILYEHPAIIDTRDNLKVLGESLWIDYEGLAQHYGLMTELMDFSSDPWVAAFFAVSWFDADSQRYLPVRTGAEDGIFYRFNLVLDKVKSSIRHADIVGMQPLKRPGEQKAFSVRVRKGECLHNKKTMSAQRFRHDTLVSERILERFLGGDALLPEDPVAKKAMEIASLKLFSRHAFNECVARYWSGVNKASLVRRLKRRGVSITEALPCYFSIDELSAMQEEWLKRRNRFASLIRVRLVAEHYNGQA